MAPRQTFPAALRIAARFRLRGFVAPCLGLLMAMPSLACSGGGGGNGNGDGASLTAITISPTDGSVARGGTIDLTATGTYDDDSTEDLSDVVTWASQNQDVAAVAEGGAASGAGCGLTSISALEPETLLSDYTVLAVSGCVGEGSPGGGAIALAQDEEHSGEVGTSASYYSAALPTPEEGGYRFSLYGMSDDLDLLLYGNDGFTTLMGSCTASSRYAEESCDTGPVASEATVFVKVSGAASSAGSSYQIVFGTGPGNSSSQGDPSSQGYNRGVIAPVLVDPFRMGGLFKSSVGDSDPSYYEATVIPGVPAQVHLLESAGFGSSLEVNLDLVTYQDEGLSQEACSSESPGAGNEECRATPRSGALWVEVVPHGAGTFFDFVTLINEGKSSAPIRLGVNKGNLGTVRAGTSYYKFPVNPSTTYNIGIVTYMSNPVTLSVYGGDSSFGSAVCTSVPSYNGRGPAGTPCTWTADGPTLYVKVRSNSEDVGSFFGIDVTAQ